MGNFTAAVGETNVRGPEVLRWIEEGRRLGRTCRPGRPRFEKFRSADLMSKKLKILLAEDDPFLCRYIKTLISQWECDLAVERTAEGAIQRAATFKPNVALLGFITPGMNGAEAGIRLLRNSPETRVVLTVESVPSEVLDDLRARGYDFRTLAAPFNIEELQDLCFSSHQEEE